MTPSMKRNLEKKQGEDRVRERTTAYREDQRKNPIQSRPVQGRKSVVGKAGGTVAVRTEFTDPNTPEVGFSNVEGRKRSSRERPFRMERHMEKIKKPTHEINESSAVLTEPQSPFPGVPARGATFDETPKISRKEYIKNRKTPRRGS